MYKNFTGESMNYDLERYNFPAWALERIQQKFPQVTELETIHETVPLKRHSVTVMGFCWLRDC